jgi:hypothetical protein
VALVRRECPALLAFVLGTNLGTRTVTGRRLLLPVVLVLVAGWIFLRDLPTTDGDTRLELADAVTGVGPRGRSSRP